MTYLLEAADDIAYKTADIEDAFKKGLLSYEALEEALGDEFSHILTDRYNGDKYNAVQNFIVEAQRLALKDAALNFEKHYDEIMQGDFSSDLLNDCDGGRLLDILGKTAFRYVFSSREIYLSELGGSNILNFLLDSFVNAALNQGSDNVDDKLFSLISDNYKRSYDFFSENGSQEDKLYLKLMLVTDYISGMTDSYAKELCLRLKGIS